MRKNDRDKLVSECMAVTVRGHDRGELPREDVEAFLGELLYTDKELWWALTSRLLSVDEVTAAITDRLHTWLGHRAVALPSTDAWPQHAARVRALLVRASTSDA